MKKLLSFLSGIILIILVLGFFMLRLSTADGGKTDDNTLTLFNWGDYIDEELITKFEDETGYKVNYTTFDNNEALYQKLKQGGTSYDIVVPSDYMVEKMAKENLLEPLDKSKIQGLSNIESRLLNPVFDKGNQYSIPYFWGTLGIVYNDMFVKEPPKTWNDIWNPKYKDSILLTDSSRDVWEMPFAKNGFSTNTKNRAELDKAFEDLKKLTPNVKAILGDEVSRYMINNEAPMAAVYSGVGSQMIAENEHLHYVIPEQTNIWYDNMAIPKVAKNLKAAYAFLNFMLRPENAAKNAEYVGYSTPNKKGRELLPDDVKNDKLYYPDDKTLENAEAYSDLGQYWTGIYNDLYLEFKMNK